MRYYHVKNWRRFQHYKHRNPPWIKLHYEIFTSSDWVMLADASKLLAIACMLIASRNDGMVPDDPHYIKRVAYLETFPDFLPLISCGFLSELLADASISKQLRTNAITESRIQSTEKIESNGFKNGLGGKRKPRHGAKTKDGARLWLDCGTIEWAEYAKDYKAAHSGIDPPVQWNGAGTWFNLTGETQQ